MIENYLSKERKLCRMWTGKQIDYDIFLACDISQEASKQKIPFYEKIGEIGKKAGYNIFLPHKEVGINLPDAEDNPREVYTMMRVVIPSTMLVIAYLGIESTDVGIMTGMAVFLGKDLVYLSEEDKKPLSILDGAIIRRIIKYRNEEDAANQLEKFLMEYAEK